MRALAKPLVVQKKGHATMPRFKLNIETEETQPLLFGPPEIQRYVVFVVPQADFRAFEGESS